jgi:hypothetical protein
MKKILFSLMVLFIIFPLVSKAATTSDDAVKLVKSGKDLKTYLKYLNKESNIDLQNLATSQYTAPLVKGEKITQSQKYVINNFFVYGTKNVDGYFSNQTDKINAIKSFKAKYKRLPTNEKDWGIIIKQLASLRVCIKKPDNKVIPIEYSNYSGPVNVTSYNSCLNSYSFSTDKIGSKSITVSFKNLTTYEDRIKSTKNSKLTEIVEEFTYKKAPGVVVKYHSGGTGYESMVFVYLKYKNGYLDVFSDSLKATELKKVLTDYVDSL